MLTPSGRRMLLRTEQLLRTCCGFVQGRHAGPTHRVAAELGLHADPATPPSNSPFATTLLAATLRAWHQPGYGERSFGTDNRSTRRRACWCVLVRAEMLSHPCAGWANGMPQRGYPAANRQPRDFSQPPPPRDLDLRNEQSSVFGPKRERPADNSRAQNQFRGAARRPATWVAMMKPLLACIAGLASANAAERYASFPTSAEGLMPRYFVDRTTPLIKRDGSCGDGRHDCKSTALTYTISPVTTVPY